MHKKEENWYKKSKQTSTDLLSVNVFTMVNICQVLHKPTGDPDITADVFAVLVEFLWKDFKK